MHAVSTHVHGTLNTEILDSSSDCVGFSQASAKFRWAAQVVIVLSRVLKAIVNYSADLIPETAAQRSFRTLRDNSEVKEMLFNKSLYQRGKSVRLCILMIIYNYN